MKFRVYVVLHYLYDTVFCNACFILNLYAWKSKMLPVFRHD
nr:MAG TPA: hypothetical protein [Herelleviridae sp.]